MQMRAALVALLTDFKLEICEKTPKKIEFDAKSFILSPIGGVHLRITKV